MAKRHGLQLTERRAAQLDRYAQERPCFTRRKGTTYRTARRPDGQEYQKQVKPRNSPVPGFRFKP